MVKICLVTDNLKVCVLSCIIFLNFFLLVLDWCCNHLVLFICVYGLDTLVHSNQMSRHQTATLKYTKKIRLICGLPLYTKGAQPATQVPHVAHNAILVTEIIWLQKSLSVSGGCSHLFYMEKLGIKWQTDWIILMVHCVVISEARMGLSWTQHGSPVKSRSDGEVAMHKCGYIHCSGWMLWNTLMLHQLISTAMERATCTVFLSWVRMGEIGGSPGSGASTYRTFMAYTFDMPLMSQCLRQ